VWSAGNTESGFFFLFDFGMFELRFLFIKRVGVVAERFFEARVLAEGEHVLGGGVV
jgi:hypothetical protein